MFSPNGLRTTGRPFIPPIFLSETTACCLWSVQSSTERNDALAEDLTALDIDVAGDSAFDQLNLDVLSVPCASEDATSAFLSSGRVQKYAK